MGGGINWEFGGLALDIFALISRYLDTICSWEKLLAFCTGLGFSKRVSSSALNN